MIVCCPSVSFNEIYCVKQINVSKLKNRRELYGILTFPDRLNHGGSCVMLCVMCGLYCPPVFLLAELCNIVE